MPGDPYDRGILGRCLCEAVKGRRVDGVRRGTPSGGEGTKGPEMASLRVVLARAYTLDVPGQTWTRPGAAVGPCARAWTVVQQARRDEHEPSSVACPFTPNDPPAALPGAGVPRARPAYTAANSRAE